MGFRDGVEGAQDRLFDWTGEDIVYTTFGQTPKALPRGGIFRNEGQQTVLDTGATVTTRRPLLDVRLRSLAPFVPQPNRDDVVVRGQRWTVQEVADDDGEGIVTLLLTNPRRFG